MLAACFIPSICFFSGKAKSSSTVMDDEDDSFDSSDSDSGSDESEAGPDPEAAGSINVEDVEAPPTAVVPTSSEPPADDPGSSRRDAQEQVTLPASHPRAAEERMLSQGLGGLRGKGPQQNS